MAKINSNDNYFLSEKFFIIIAGFPPTTTIGGTSFTTTLFAETTEPLPIVTPGKTIELAPIQTLSAIVTGLLVPSSIYSIIHVRK